MDDADVLLRAGADRVVVNTAAVERSRRSITRIAERFGSQCVVVAVDGKRVMTESGVGRGCS